jgi:hypothetical protein
VYSYQELNLPSLRKWKHFGSWGWGEGWNERVNGLLKQEGKEKEDLREEALNIGQHFRTDEGLLRTASKFCSLCKLFVLLFCNSS